MEERKRVALVTGANRGLGFEIVGQLARRGLTVILAARTLEQGETAAWSLASRGLDVVARPLDITNQHQVDALVEELRSTLGFLDILVNNAGVLLDGGQSACAADLSLVHETLETNLFGAWQLSQAVLPLMLHGGYGRIVNISSSRSVLRHVSVSTGTWPAYRISKVGLNAMTIILAAELQGTNILVNAACPGWVRTTMGGASAPRSVVEGADTPVWLATLPDNGPSGGFFQNRTRIPW